MKLAYYFFISHLSCKRSKMGKTMSLGVLNG